MTQQMERPAGQPAARAVEQGQLADEPLPHVLQRLAGRRASGDLIVHGPDGEVGRVHLHDGLIVGANAQAPALAARLVSSAALTPEMLDFLEHGGATDGLPSNQESARLLAEYGCADPLDLGAAMSELVHDSVARLCSQTSGSWQLRAVTRRPAAGPDAAGGAPVADLLPRLEQRRREWSALAAAVGGPTTVPGWSAAIPSGRLEGLSSDGWALLCRVDGSRSLAELAEECGFTLLEAARALLALIHRGLILVAAAGETPLRPVGSSEPGAGPAGGYVLAPQREPADTASLLRELSSLGLEDLPATAARTAGRIPAQERKTKRRTLFSR